MIIKYKQQHIDNKTEQFVPQNSQIKFMRKYVNQSLKENIFIVKYSLKIKKKTKQENSSKKRVAKNAR